MSEEGEQNIEKRLSSLVPLVKSLIGGAFAIGAAIVGIAIWVYSQQDANAKQEVRLDKIEPRVSQLENWKLVRDSSPIVTLTDMHNLDKRLQKNEDQLSTIKEQNALILQELRNIQGKP